MVLGNQRIHSLGYPKVDGPASLDVTLCNTILVPRRTNGFVRLGSQIQYSLVPYTAEKPFILAPGAFVLGATNESINLPSDLCAFIQGRSSIGRIGLSIQNAGFIDPGFYGTITLELKNDSPNAIALVPGYRVGQVVFLEVSGSSFGYRGKYNGQQLPTGSRMHMDEEAKK